jgi:hypothetical protein
MADQEKDRQTAEMLDSLLANYSSAEPRPGLETRILANLREVEKKAPQGWWNFKWIWAGLVAAPVVIAMVLVNVRHRVTPPTNTVVETRQPAPQPEIQPHAPAAPQVTARIHQHKPLAVPAARENATLALSKRPAIFPTPTPLSEQEQLLLQYYSHTPREELIAQSHPDDPPVMGNQDQTEAIPDLIHIPQKLSNTR